MKKCSEQKLPIGNYFIFLTHFIGLSVAVIANGQMKKTLIGSKTSRKYKQTLKDKITEKRVEVEWSLNQDKFSSMFTLNGPFLRKYQ